MFATHPKGLNGCLCVRYVRQDTDLWDALHQGILTTGRLNNALGFYEPLAGKMLGVPRSRISHQVQIPELSLTVALWGVLNVRLTFRSLQIGSMHLFHADKMDPVNKPVLLLPKKPAYLLDQSLLALGSCEICVYTV